MQADFGEKTIHQKRGAGQIAGIFKDRKKQKQHRDLRHEDDHRAHAFEHAAHQQILDRPLRKPFRGDLTEPVDTVLQAVHDRLRRPEQGDEERSHDEGEDEQTPDFMNQNRINFLRECTRLSIVENGRGLGLGGDDALGDSVDPTVMGFYVRLHWIDAKGGQTIGR